MFALALWDGRRRRLLLARDHFGKKPLYVWRDARRLVFASEIKALLAAGAPAALNEAALPEYLALGYVPTPRTLFAGIERLPPEAAERERPAVLADIFAPGIIGHTVLGATLGAMALIGTWGAVQFLPNWADVLARGTSWAGAARSETQIASSVGAIVGSLLAGFVADRLSRRTTYFLLSVLSLAACGWLFWTPAAYGLEFLLVVGTVGMFTASFYGWLPLYLPELFPTRLRATGAGFSFNFGRVLAAGGALVSGAIIDAHGEDYSVMGRTIMFVYVLGAAVIWLCPETKGKPLPD